MAGSHRAGSLLESFDDWSRVDIEISDDALEWVRDHGGTAAVDFIPPIG